MSNNKPKTDSSLWTPSDPARQLEKLEVNEEASATSMLFAGSPMAAGATEDSLIKPVSIFDPNKPKNSHDPYQPIELDFITLDTICDQPIYLKNDGKYVLYRGGKLEFTMRDKERLELTKNKVVYIHCPTEGDLQKFFESNLTHIIENPKIDSKKKADVLYKCASGIAADIFASRITDSTIIRSRDVVGNTMKLLAGGSDAFLQMIKLSSHDYYTYTHSVNVMTFSVALMNAMGIKDPRLLKETGIGALLHDVGKSKVPIDILNKPGPLTDDEWQVMKKHPSFGLEMLDPVPVPDSGRNIVVQHHEKISGVGYPYGLKGDSIALQAQVVSICDAYDAMTTNRCYQKAKRPYDAFKIIMQDMKGHFAPGLVEAFIKILNLKQKS